MSNTYGSGDAIRRLLEAYLASQNELATEEVPEDELVPLLTGEQQNFAGAIPMYDLEGDPQSYTSMFNQLQDFNQLLADPLFQGGGGPGAWSQQAFQPTVNYEVVDSPEYQRWMNYLRTEDSPEGMIAAELQGGGTPMSAIRKIQAKIAAEPEGQLAKDFALFFPAVDPDGVPTGEIDWTMASEAATKIDEIRAEVPPIGGTGSITMPDGTVVPAGEIMEVDGQLVKRTEEPSELMQHFNELGLPSPFEEYTPASFLGPEWAGQVEEFAAGPYGQGGMETVDAALREAYESMLRNEDWSPPARPAPTREEEGGGGGEEGPPPEPAGRVYIPGGISGEPTPIPVESPPEEASEQLLTALSLGPDEVTPYVQEHYDEFSPQDIDAIHDQMLTMSSSGDPAWSEAMIEFLDAMPEEPNILDEGGGNTGWTRSIRDFWSGGGGYNDADRFGTQTPLPEAGGGQVGIVPTGGGGNRPQVGPMPAGWRELPASLRRGEPVPPPGDLTMEPSEADQWFGQQPPAAGPQATQRSLLEYLVPPYAQPGAQQARQPGDYTPQPLPPYAQPGAQQARQPGDYTPPGPPSPAATWPPTLIYDPWAAQQATEQTMRENLYRPPEGGYATLEEAAAAGSPAARRYLEENGPTPQYTPDENYEAPPGGFPTLEAAAAAGSPVAIEYLRETGYRTPRRRPMRHPEEPMGGEQYERMLTESRERAARLRDTMLAAILPQGPVQQRQGGPPRSEAVTTRTGETGLEEPPPTRPTENPYAQMIGAMVTGEQRQPRTEEERRRLARERTEEDWEYDPTTGIVNKRVASRNQFRRAFQERSHYLVGRQKELDRLYGRGSGFGEAMAATYRAHLAGASPLQQVYAQRVQNVANAGIPIGARPGLVQY